jgi:Tfp pilus assembly protein PilO
MKYLFPVILILASVGLFFVYTNPSYVAVADLRAQQSSYNEALGNAKQLQAIRDTLVAKYNALPQDFLDRLTKLMPDNVDNIKLILEINKVAGQYGMQIKNIKYDVAKPAPVAGQFVAQAPATPHKDYGEFNLEFSVEGPYGSFVQFTQSLEQSLRIVDVQSVSFSSSDASPGSKGTYKYDFKIKTYWLKG